MNNSLNQLLNNSKNSKEKFSHRCLKCNKLLANEAIDKGAFEVKCLRCGEINTIFREMKEQLVITDPKGKILYVNGEIEHIIGYSLHEVVGRTPKVWGGQMPKKFYEKLWRIISIEKKGMVAKLTNRHKTGRLYDVMLRVSPIKDAEGNIIFFVGIETPLNYHGSLDGEWSMPKIDL